MKERNETVSLNELLTTDVHELDPELEAYQSIFAECFGRREQREKCHTNMQGLLQQVPNKSIETMMLHNDGDNPNSIRAMQHFISQGAWDDAAVLCRHAVEVDKDLGDEDGVLIVDGSDFHTWSHECGHIWYTKVRQIAEGRNHMKVDTYGKKKSRLRAAHSKHFPLIGHQQEGCTQVLEPRENTRAALQFTELCQRTMHIKWRSLPDWLIHS